MRQLTRQLVAIALLLPTLASASINSVENNQVTTAKLANGSVTTPKLSGEAHDGLTLDGKFLINVNGSAEFKQLKSATLLQLHMRGISGQNAKLSLSADGASQSADTWAIESTAANDLTFTNGAISATMVMDNGGNVGIGTASPSSKLHVSTGGVIIDGTGTQLQLEAIYSPEMKFRRYTNFSDGAQPLAISALGPDDAGGEFTWATIKVLADDASAGTKDSSIVFQTFDNDTLADRMTIKSGNVGIGTASPGDKLEVAGRGSFKDSGTYTPAIGMRYSGGTYDTAFLGVSNSFSRVILSGGSEPTGNIPAANSMTARGTNTNATALNMSSGDFLFYSNSGLTNGATFTPTQVMALDGSAGNLSITGDSVTIATAQTPASNAACTTGEVAWGADYIYICTATTVWKRAALTGGY